MSWAANEWKDGLSARALQKVEEYEKHVDRLNKQSQQKQFQLDALQQALDKQKKRVDEEKKAATTLKNENQSLIESCVELEKKHQKLEHDIQSKDSRISWLDGQLNRTQQSIDTETSKATNLKNELERLQGGQSNTDDRYVKLSADHNKLQELSNHQRKQLEESMEKNRNLHNELKMLQSELERQQCGLSSGANLRHLSGGSGEVNSLKQKLSDCEKQKISITEEKEALEKQLQSLSGELHSLKTKLSVSETNNTKWSSDFENLQLSSLSKQNVLEQQNKDNSAVSDVQFQQMEKMVDQLTRETETFKNKCMNSELAVQARKKEVDELKEKLKVSQVDLDDSNKLLIERENLIDQLKEEKMKLKSGSEESEQKIVACEEKIQKIMKELECQRHNSEAAIQAKEIKLKEKEKEHKIELSHQIDSIQGLQKLLDETKHQLQQQTSRAKLDADQVDKLHSTVDKTQRELNMVRKQHEELQNQHQSISHSKEQIAKDLQDKTKQCQELSNKCEQMTQRSEALEHRLKERDTLAQNLKDQVQNMEATVSKLKEDKDRANKENMKELESLQSELSQKQTVLDAKLKEIEYLKSSVSGIQDTIHNEKNKCEAKDKEIKSLKQECADIQCKLDEISPKLTEKEQLLSISKAQVLSLENNFEGIRREKQSMEEKSSRQISEVQTKLTDKESQLDCITKNLEDTKRLCSNLKNQMENYQLESEKKQSEVTEMKKTCDKLQGETEDSQQKLLSKEKELEQALAQSQSLEKSFQSLKQDITFSEEKFNKELDKLKKDLGVKENVVQEKEKEIDTLRLNISDLKDSNDKTNELIKGKHSELENVKSECDALNQKLCKTKEAQEQAKKDAENITAQCSKLESELNHVKQEKTHLENSTSIKLHDLSIQLDETKGQLEHKVKQLEASNGTITDLAEAGQKFKTQISGRDTEIKDLKVELNKLQNYSDRINEELETTTQQLSETKSCISTYDQNIRDLKEHHSKNEKEQDDKIKTLMVQLEGARHKLDENCATLADVNAKFEAVSELSEHSQAQAIVLQQSLNEFKEKCDVLEGEKSTLSIELHSLNETVASKEVHIAFLTKNVETLKSEKQISEKKVREELENVHVQMEYKAAILEQKLGDCETLTNAKVDLERKVEELTKIIKEKEEELLESQSMHAELAGKLDSDRFQLEEKQKELDKLMTDSESLKNSLEMVRSDAAADCKKMKEEINDLISTNEKLESSALDMELVIETSQTRIENMVSENERLQSCTERLSTDLSEIQSERSSLDQKMSALEESKTSLSKEFATQQEKSETVIQDLNTKIAAAEDTIKSGEAQLQNLQIQMEIGSETVESLQTALSGSEQKKENLEQQCLSLSKQVTEMRDTDEKLRKEMEVINVTKANLERDLVELQENSKENTKKFESVMVEKNAAITAFQEKFASKTDEINQLQQLIDDSSNAARAYDDQISTLNSKNAQLEQSYQSLKSEMVEAQDKFVALKEEHEKAGTELNETANNLLDLTSSLENSQADLRAAKDKITCLEGEKKVLVEKAEGIVSQLDRMCKKNEDLAAENEEQLDMLSLCRKEYGDKLYESEVELIRANDKLQEAQDLVKQLTADIKSKNIDIVELSDKQEVTEESHEKLKKLQSEEVERHRAADEKYVQTFAELKQQLETLRQSNEKATFDLSESQKLVSSVEEENRDFIKRLEDEVSTLKEELTQMRQLVLEKDGEISCLQQQLLASCEEKENTSREVDSLKELHERELSGLRQAESTLQKSFEEKSALIAELEIQIRDLQESSDLELVSIKQQLESKTKEIESMTQRLTEEDNLHRVSIDDINGAHEFALTEAKKEIQSLQESVQRAQELSSSKEDEVHSLQQKIGAEIAKFNVEFSQAKNVQDGLRDRIVDLESQLSAAQTELEKKGVNVCRLEDKLVSLEQDIISSSQKIEGFKDEKEGMMDDYKTLQEQLQEASKNLEDKEKEIGHLSQLLQTEKESNQVQKVDFEETSAQFGAQLDEVKIANEGLEKVNSSLKDQRDELQSFQSDLHTTIAGLKQELNDFETRVAQLEINISDKEEEFAKALAEKINLISAMKAHEESLKLAVEEKENELKDKIETLGTSEQEVFANKEYMLVLERKLADEATVHATELSNMSSQLAELQTKYATMQDQMEVGRLEFKEESMKEEGLRLQLEESLTTERAALSTLQSKLVEVENTHDRQLHDLEDERLNWQLCSDAEKATLLEETEALKAKINDLEDTLVLLKTDAGNSDVALHSKLEEVQNVNCSLREKIEEFEKLIQTKDNLISEKKDKIQCLEQELCFTATDLASSQNDSEVATSHATQLLEKLKKADVELETARNQLSELNTEIESRDSAISDLKQDICNLRSSTTSEIIKLEESIEGYKQQVETLEEDLQKDTSEKEGLNTCIKDYTERVSELEQQVRDIQSTLDLTVVEKSGLQTEIQRLVEDNDVVKHLEADISKLREELSISQNLCERKTEEIDLLSTQLCAAKESITVTESQASTLATSFEFQQKDLEKSISRLEGEVKVFKDDADLLQSECDSKQEKIDALTLEQSDMKKQHVDVLTDLQTKFTNTEKECSGRISSLQSLVKSLQEEKECELGQHQDEINKMETELSNLKVQITCLVKEKESGVSELQRHAQEADEKCSADREKIDCLEKEIASLIDDSDALKTEIDCLSKNVTSYECEITDLKNVKEELILSVSSEVVQKTSIEKQYNELMETNQASLKGLEESNQQISSLTNEMKESAVSFKDERTNYELKLSEKDSFIKEEIEKYVDLSQKFQSLQENRGSDDAMLADLKSKNHSLEERLASVAERRDIIQTQIDELASETDVANKMHTTLVQELEGTKNSLEDELNAYVVKYDKLTLEKTTLADENHTLRATVDDMEKMKSELETELASVREYEQQVKSQVFETQSNVMPTQTYPPDDILSQIQNFGVEHLNLKSAIEALEASNADLSSKMAEIKQEQSETEVKLQQAEAKLTKLEDEKELLTSDVAEKQMQISAEQSEKYELDNSLKTLKSDLDQNQKQMDDLQSTADNYKRMCRELEAELEAESQTNQRFASELDVAHRQISELAPVIQSLQDNLKTTEVKNFDQAKQIEELEQTLYETRNDTMAKDSSFCELEKDVRVLRTALDDLRHEKNEVDKSLAQTRQTIENHEKQINDLHENVNIKTKRISELTKDLNHSKSKAAKLADQLKEVEAGAKSSTSQLTKEIELLKRDKFVLEELSRTAEEEKQALASNLETFSQELNNVHQKCNIKQSGHKVAADIDIAGQLCLLQDEILALQAEKEELQTQQQSMQSLRESNELLQSRLNVQMQEGDSVSTNMLEAQAKLCKVSAENEVLKEKVTESERNMNLLAVEKDGVEAQLNKSIQEHSDLREKLAKTEKALSDALVKIEFHKSDVDLCSQESISAAQLELTSLEAEKTSLSAQVSEQKKDIEHLESKVKMLHTQLQHRNEEAQVLNEKLEAFTTLDSSTSSNSSNSHDTLSAKKSQQQIPLPGIKVTTCKQRNPSATRGKKKIPDTSTTEINSVAEKTKDAAAVQPTVDPIKPSVEIVKSPRERLSTKRLSDRLKKKTTSEPAKDTLKVEPRPKRPSLEDGSDNEAKKPRLPIGAFKTPDKLRRDDTKPIVTRPEARRPLATQASLTASHGTQHIAKPTPTVPKVSPNKVLTESTGATSLFERITTGSAFKKIPKNTTSGSETTANAAKLLLSRSRMTVDKSTADEKAEVLTSITNSPKKEAPSSKPADASKGFTRVPRRDLSLKGRTPKALRSRAKPTETKDAAGDVEGEKAEDCKIQ